MMPEGCMAALKRPHDRAVLKEALGVTRPSCDDCPDTDCNGQNCKMKGTPVKFTEMLVIDAKTGKPIEKHISITTEAQK